MTVTPNQWVANEFQLVEDILVASSTLRGWWGAADVASARAFVRWQAQRNALTGMGALITMPHGSAERGSNAMGVVTHGDEIDVYLVWPVVPIAGDDKGTMIQAINDFGQVLADIYGAVGGAGLLDRARLTFEPPTRLPDDSALAGNWDATITFNIDI